MGTIVCFLAKCLVLGLFHLCWFSEWETPETITVPVTGAWRVSAPSQPLPTAATRGSSVTRREQPRGQGHAHLPESGKDPICSWNVGPRVTLGGRERGRFLSWCMTRETQIPIQVGQVPEGNIPTDKTVAYLLLLISADTQLTL